MSLPPYHPQSSTPDQNYRYGLPQDRFDPNTPPPPPPKPYNQDHSGRRDTPTSRAGPSAAPIPGQQQQHVGGPSDSQAPYGQDGQQAHMPAQRQPLSVPEVLREKSKDDLSYVLHSPALLSALASTSFSRNDDPQAVLASHIESNLAMARSLKALEARLVAQRESTQTHLLQLHGMDRQWRDKQKEMDSAMENFSPKALYQQLNVAMGESAQVCDALEESFVRGGEKATEREIADFLKEYRDARKRWYMRKEKKERWDEGRVGGWR